MSIHKIFVLSLIHESGFTAARVLLVLSAVEQGAQPLTIGLLAAMCSVFPMSLGVLIGRLSDRYGARRPLAAAAILGLATMLVPFFAPGLQAVFVAAVILGLYDSLCGITLQSLVGVISDPRNRARNYSNYSLVTAGAALLGPLVIGLSIDHAGHAQSFLLLAIFLSLPIAVLLIGNEAPRVTTPASQEHGGAMAMLANPEVRRVLFTSSLMSAANHLFQIYMPVYCHGVGLSATSIGMVLAVNAGAMMISRVLLPSLVKRFKEQRILTFVLISAASTLILVPLFQSFPALITISVTFGLAMGFSAPLIIILMYANSARGRSGEGLGLKIVVNHMTKIVSPIALGALGSAFGIPPIFWINGLMIGLVGVMGLQRRTSEAGKPT